MKILQLCSKPPYPPVDGGTLAMNSITQGLLCKGHSVKVLSVESDKHKVNHHLMTDEYKTATNFESVYINLKINAFSAFTAWLSGESYHVKRFRSSAFAQKLTEILQQDTYDIVHIESIFLTPYLPVIRQHSNAKVILRAHNVEHLIWQRLAGCTSDALKRNYLKSLSLTLKNYELGHINDYDGIVCITAKDMDYFAANCCTKPMSAIPFGVDFVDDIEYAQEEDNSLFHIGSMDWQPNKEGVQWFLDEVWPLINAELPQLRLYLAGRKMPEKLLKAKIPNVSIVGEIPDSMYFIASKKINIVPLLSGSGIRVKIIEAMSAGKVVISTAIGAEGINCTDGKDILIANTPQEFVNQLKRCLDDPDFCHTVSNNARQLIKDDYNTPKTTEKLVAFYNGILK